MRSNSRRDHVDSMGRGKSRGPTDGGSRSASTSSRSGARGRPRHDPTVDGTAPVKTPGTALDTRATSVYTLIGNGRARRPLRLQSVPLSRRAPTRPGDHPTVRGEAASARPPRDPVFRPRRSGAQGPDAGQGTGRIPRPGADDPDAHRGVARAKWVGEGR